MTSGIDLNCLHSENVLYGRLATESSSDLCVEFAVKRGEFVCILGTNMEYCYLGVRFSVFFKNIAKLEKFTYLAFNALVTTAFPSSLDAEP